MYWSDLNAILDFFLQSLFLFSLFVFNLFVNFDLKLLSSFCLFLTLCSQLQEDELRDAVLLIFANKQDLPNALGVTELSEKLGLQRMSGRTVRLYIYNYLHNWYLSFPKKSIY